MRSGAAAVRRWQAGKGPATGAPRSDKRKTRGRLDTGYGCFRRGVPRKFSSPLMKRACERQCTYSVCLPLRLKHHATSPRGSMYRPIRASCEMLSHGFPGHSGGLGKMNASPSARSVAGCFSGLSAATAVAGEARSIGGGAGVWVGGLLFNSSLLSMFAPSLRWSVLCDSGHRSSVITVTGPL